jgi:hypothetical protein
MPLPPPPCRPVHLFPAPNKDGKWGYAFVTKELKPYSDEIWKERRMG